MFKRILNSTRLLCVLVGACAGMFIWLPFESIRVYKTTEAFNRWKADVLTAEANIEKSKAERKELSGKIERLGEMFSFVRDYSELSRETSTIRLPSPKGLQNGDEKGELTKASVRMRHWLAQVQRVRALSAAGEAMFAADPALAKRYEELQVNTAKFEQSLTLMRGLRRLEVPPIVGDTNPGILADQPLEFILPDPFEVARGDAVDELVAIHHQMLGWYALVAAIDEKMQHKVISELFDDPSVFVVDSQRIGPILELGEEKITEFFELAVGASLFSEEDADAQQQ